MFTENNVALTPIGQLKNPVSQDITQSPISIGFECLDREMFDPEPCYDLLANAGIKWARCQTGWARCEKVKGKYTFDWLDSVVEQLLKRGIKPWFNVGYGNPLYMNNTFSEAAVGCVPLYYGKETILAWQNYIKALAAHFKGKIKYFEIWNEPDIANFWQPESSNPEDYARLIEMTSDMIRSEIPEARIGACNSSRFGSFAVRLLRSGIARTLNFYCFHAYAVQPELNYAQVIAMIRRTLDENGGKHVEIWQGEAGFASWFPSGHYLNYIKESEQNQAIWLLRRYVTDIAHGIKVSSFFQAADMMGKKYQTGNDTRPQPARHGILNGIYYTPKTAYTAMKHIAAVFSEKTQPAELFMAVYFFNAHSWNQRHSRLLDIGVQCNAFTRNQYPIFEYHLAEDMQYGFKGLEKIEIRLENKPNLKPMQNPVLIDLLSGKVSRIENFTHEKDVFIYCKNLPLTDYPLLICDASAYHFEPLPTSRTSY
ncbi:MAG: beta-galactosidase [Lentisphaeria bacterium]|nr:beta-galactosidase [Lentisphaeria bacterium]